jgi:hypothetical protein
LIGTRGDSNADESDDGGIRSSALAEVEGLSEDEMNAIVEAQIAKLVK